MRACNTCLRCFFFRTHGISACHQHIIDWVLWYMKNMFFDRNKATHYCNERTKHAHINRHISSYIISKSSQHDLVVSHLKNGIADFVSISFNENLLFILILMFNIYWKYWMYDMQRKSNPKILNINLFIALNAFP